jgi:hypothetical protein
MSLGALSSSSLPVFTRFIAVAVILSPADDAHYRPAEATFRSRTMIAAADDRAPDCAATLDFSNEL